ncbi:MAG TPA: hypothetical protein VE710_07210 [Candidatus Bathyarchaeia archaeon]|nr:hypothetical protein [Candidatus Bathyarchaeia archaeon]
MTKTSLALLITITACFLLLTGCTGGIEREENAQPTASEATESISNVVEAAVSVSDKIPDSFPKDIPIPDDIEMPASMTHDDSITITFDARKSFDETLNIYKEYYKSAGYQMTSETLIDDSYMGTGTLGDNELQVTISMTTDDSNLASVSLTYQSSNQ